MVESRSRQPAVKRALVSVSDKTGLVEFCKGLVGLGVEIVSTGGTAQHLSKNGVPVIPVEDVTGFPEMMGGRVKTLHPKIHGGILALRGEPSHQAAMQKHGIAPIDLVAVNLYPFVQTAFSVKDFDEVVEQIDIGGPAMVRAAAKNHAHVVIVVDPSRYEGILAMLRKQGDVGEEDRLALAAEAYRHTSAYDAAISQWMAQVSKDESFPRQLPLAFEKVQELRYGENPHQKGALYRSVFAPPGTLATAQVLGGKELSYNNLLDADAAWACALEIAAPACVIVKHNTPCGAAQANAPAEALRLAWACDPVSAYGSIVAFNRTVDKDVAEALAAPDHFVEVVVAPEFGPRALEILKEKRKNTRLLQCDRRFSREGLEARRISGGILVQQWDAGGMDRSKVTVVTKKQPTEAQWQDLEFAWKVVKHVKSNAIVLAREGRTVGIGSGQTNRVDSVRLAAGRAKELAKGSVLASDAFFPFADGVQEAIAAGVAAILQPGGSIRDAECIAAADKAGVAMGFTAIRHFRH